MPDGLKIYRTWQGGDATKGIIKSLILLRVEVLAVLLCWMPLNQVSNIFLSLLLIYLGAQQWEKDDGGMSRLQNNIYKNTSNYPDRTT
jgi:hypothetical protein